MALFTSVLLSVSLSIDALGVGVSYGIRKVRVPAASKCIICFLSVLFAAIGEWTGSFLYTVLPPAFSKWCGAGILFVMGLFILFQALRKEKDETVITIPKKEKIVSIAIKSLGLVIQVVRDPSLCDIDRSKHIDPLESLLLGFALSVDAIGVGIGFSLSGQWSLFTPLLIGIFQWLFLCIGLFSGEKLRQIANPRLKSLISLLPGIILLGLSALRFI